jgi:sugar lactone lactonase YvrE
MIVFLRLFLAAAAAWMAAAPASAQFCMSDPECDDGQVCNGVEFCDLMGGGFCQSGMPVACNDGDPCTFDICNEPGTCTFVSSGDGEAAAGPDALCNTTDDNLDLFGTDGSCGTMDDLTGDGYCALVDNCDLAYNPGQEDSDRDLAGDACDATPCLARGLYAIGGSALYRVDPATGEETFILGGLSGARDVAVDPTETLAVVTSFSANQFSVVDLVTRQVVNTFGLSGPWGVDAATQLDFYVVERNSGTLERIDAQGGFGFPVAFGLSDPTGLDVNAAGTFAFVTEFTTGELSRVNVSSGAITLVAGGLSDPLAVALDPGETAAYVIENDIGRLSRVDLGMGTVTTVTSSLQNPQGIALDVAGTVAYVTDSSFGLPGISAVNLSSGVVTAVTDTMMPGAIFNDGLTLSPRPPVVMSAPDPGSGTPGSNVSLPVTLDDVAGLGVLSADFAVEYNPAVLTITNATTGTLTSGCTLTANHTTGRSVVSVFCTSPISGSPGSIASLSATVGGSPGQGSTLDFTSALLNEGTPPVCADDGRLHVPVDIAGRVVYYRDSAGGTEPSTKPVDDATVEVARLEFDEMTGMLVPVTVASPVTDCNGDYSAAGLEPILTYRATPAKAGDFGGAIDPFDASLNAQHVVGLITLTANQRLAADASGNGTLTSFDSARIAQFSVGAISQLPVAVFNGADWAFVPSPQSEPNQQISSPYPPGAQKGFIEYSPIVESAENQGFLAILFGDVSGNWQGVCPDPESLPASLLEGRLLAPSGDAQAGTAAGAGRLILPSLRVRQGDSFTVPVDAAGAAGAVSFYLDLRFDPAVLRLDGVSAGAAVPGFSLTSNLTEAGRARLALYSTAPTAGDGEVAAVRFTAIGRAGSRSTVTLPAYTVNEGQIPVEVREGSVVVLPRK